MTVTAAMKDGLARYISFYEALTPEGLKNIGAVFTDDARFRDPFNDVQGRIRIAEVFEDMFKTIGQPQFHVTDAAWSDKEDGTAFIRWHFTYRVRGKGADITVEGMSAMIFATDGRVRSHIDYWDAAQGLYEHLPVIGAVLRWIRSRVKIKG